MFAMAAHRSATCPSFSEREAGSFRDRHPGLLLVEQRQLDHELRVGAGVGRTQGRERLRALAGTSEEDDHAAEQPPVALLRGGLFGRPGHGRIGGTQTRPEQCAFRAG
jgi:hypothetical protein